MCFVVEILIRLAAVLVFGLRGHILPVTHKSDIPSGAFALRPRSGDLRIAMPMEGQ